MHLKIEDIYELLNGPSERKKHLLEHIQNCKECRESFEMRKKFIDLVKKMERPLLPSDFSSAVLLEIQKRESSLKRLSFLLSLFPLIISSLLILFISISGFSLKEVSSLSSQYLSFSLKVFKLLIKAGIGINKIISSFFEIFNKFYSASSSLAIPIFAILLILVFSTLIFLFLLNYLPLRGVRDENS